MNLYEFKPTHRVVMNGIQDELMDVEGALYTKEEWDSGTKADWELVEGNLFFQGSVPLCECYEFSKIKEV